MSKVVFNIRTNTINEFDLHVTVMEQFFDDVSRELDEVDVNEFYGDDAIRQALNWVEHQDGIIGEIT